LKRKFCREYEEHDIPCVIERKKIGVLGMGPGAGATFVALSLAAEAARTCGKAVAFAELITYYCGKSMTYEILGMDKRFRTRHFECFYSELAGGRYIRQLKNMDQMVNWALAVPAEMSAGLELSAADESRLVNNIYGDIVICDLGGSFNEKRIREMDVVVCVVDPLPSRLIANHDMFACLRQEEKNGADILWVINRMNSGINMRCFRDYLRLKDAVRIPLVPLEYLYTAEYNCRIPIDQREVRKELAGVFKEIITYTT
jgi:hypothetical protein